MKPLTESGSDWVALLSAAGARLRLAPGAEALEAAADLLGRLIALYRDQRVTMGEAERRAVQQAVDALRQDIARSEALARQRQIAEAEWAAAFWAAVGIEPGTSYSHDGQPVEVNGLHQMVWEG